jgi:signal transduction histidine kinase/ligand-binding sensor domain-containing protein/CheY-like chemotaxis protein
LAQGLSRVHFEHLTTEQGLASDMVYQVMKDRTGFYWFATSQGLVRYDGVMYRTFVHNPKDPQGISHSKIKCLTEDLTGKIWVGTEGGGVNVFDPASERFTVYQNIPGDAQSLSNNEVVSLLCDRRGNMWIGTEAGLNLFVPEKKGFIRFEKSLTTPNRLKADGILTLLEDHQGFIWLGTWEGGLYVFDPRTLSREVNQAKQPVMEFIQIPSPSLGTNRVWTLEQDDTGRIWVGGYGDGLFISVSPPGPDILSNPGRMEFVSIQPASAGNGISWNKVVSIRQAPSGHMWVGTGNGINICARPPGGISAEELRRHLSHNWLWILKKGDPFFAPPSDAIRNLFIENNGSVWVSTQSGIGYFNDQITYFNSYLASEDFRKRLKVEALAEDPRSNEIWIGAQTQLLSFDLNTAQTREIWTGTQPIRTLLAAPGGQIWVGGGEEVLKVDPKKKRGQPVIFPEKAAGQRIMGLYYTPDSTLWIAKQGGVYALNPHGRELKATEVPVLGLNKVEFYDIRFTSKTQFWAGSENEGLVEAHLDTRGNWEGVSHLPNPENPRSLTNMYLTSLAATDSGLWIGSGSGLYFYAYASRTFSLYGGRPGLPSMILNAITVDEPGRIWAMVPGSVGYFCQKEKGFTFFKRINGLRLNEFEVKGMIRHSSGRIFFGGENGIQEIDFGKFNQQRMPPEVQFTQLTLENTPVTPATLSPFNGKPILSQAIQITRSITLDRRFPVFTITPSLLGTADTRNAQFAYKMLGLDSDWNYSRGPKQLTYAGLRTGKYELLCKARLGTSDAWGPVSSLVIHIPPPFWTTWWFWTLVSSAVIGLIFLLIQQQLKMAASKAERLEAEVALRTADLVEANERERQARELAEQAARAKSDFLSIMSHEIRTPLHAVISMSNQLMEESPREDQVDSIQTLKISADHLLTLINNILDFSKIESEKLELEKIPFNLRELGESITRVIGVKAAQKKVAMTYFFDPSLDEWRLGDPVRISQILTNLLGNAEKFTSQGEISLAILRDAQHQTLVKVSDTGPGIPMEKQNAIFDAFSQSDTETARKFGGSGLGLNITKRLLEIMGSTIQVDSAPGKGATFSFILPLPVTQPPAEKITTLELLNVENSLKGIRILVAEDNLVNQKIVRRYLEKWGATCELAMNGKEALEKTLNSQGFHLVLMDNHMPVMDGFEATIELRKVGFTAPIIGLSAAALEEDVLRMREAGLNDFVPKPFEPSQLLEKILANLLEASETARHG